MWKVESHRTIRFRPGSEVDTWVPLGYTIKEVTVVEGNLALRVRLTKGGRVTVQFPDHEDYPRLKVGEGKRARYIPDTLSPKTVVKGLVRKYDDISHFLKENRFLGEAVYSVVAMLMG